MSDLLRFCAFSVLSLSCFLASRRSGSADRRALYILGGVAAVLGLLLVTDTIGATVQAIRAAARNDGVYQRRRPFQAAVIIGVIVLCLLTLPAVLRIARKTSRAVQGALVAATVLCGFLVVRAISLHQVDAVLNRHRLLPRLNLGDSVEIGLVLAIAVLVQLTPRSVNSEKIPTTPQRTPLTHPDVTHHSAE